MAPLKAEEENFLRFFKLLSGLTTQALKVKFDECFPPTVLRDKVQNEEEKLRHLFTVGQLNRDQLLFCTSGSISSDKFDNNLIICFLRNFATIKPPLHGYDKLPSITEISEGADLARIKYYMKKVAHSLHDVLRTQDFKEMWTDLTGAVVRLGGSQYTTKCDDLLLQQLNQDLVLEIRSELQAYKEDMHGNFLTTTVQDVHNVLIKHVNSMLSLHYEGNLTKFLIDRKHYFYHLWDKGHSACCECPMIACEISQEKRWKTGYF